MDSQRLSLKERKAQYLTELESEIERLKTRLPELGIQRAVLFGSTAWGEPGLSSDLDLIVVWDTPLDFLERTVELYRQLAPRVALDLLVYTPKEMETMAETPMIRNALEKGIILYETRSA
jgi:predicted nucleotidyltransferase